MLSIYIYDEKKPGTLSFKGKNSNIYNIDRLMLTFQERSCSCTQMSFIYILTKSLSRRLDETSAGMSLILNRFPFLCFPLHEETRSKATIYIYIRI